MSNIESTKGEIVMYQPDETLHVNNIFKEDELTESSVVKEFLDNCKRRQKIQNKDVQSRNFSLTSVCKRPQPKNY
jgi:hypothetical protein